MLRHKQKSRKETHAVAALVAHGDGERRPVPEVIEYLESFDYYLFLYDPAYRRHLDGMLSCLSEEEFESFERTYAQRFAMN